MITACRVDPVKARVWLVSRLSLDACAFSRRIFRELLSEKTISSFNLFPAAAEGTVVEEWVCIRRLAETDADSCRVSLSCSIGDRWRTRNTSGLCTGGKRTRGPSAQRHTKEFSSSHSYPHGLCFASPPSSSLLRGSLSTIHTSKTSSRVTRTREHHLVSFVEREIVGWSCGVYIFRVHAPHWRLQVPRSVLLVLSSTHGLVLCVPMTVRSCLRYIWDAYVDVVTLELSKTSCFWYRRGNKLLLSSIGPFNVDVWIVNTHRVCNVRLLREGTKIYRLRLACTFPTSKVHHRRSWTKKVAHCQRGY